MPYFYKCALNELDATIQAEIENALIFAYEHDRSDLVRRRVLKHCWVTVKNPCKEIFCALAMEQVYWTESALLAIGRTMNHEWDSTVLEYFSDENPIILPQAVHAAGLLGVYSARRPLFRMLNLDTDYDVRQEVIWALSQIGGDEVIERLEHFANITDDEDEIELIENSIEYLGFSAPTTPNLLLCLTDRTLGLTTTTMTLTAMTMMTSSKSPWIWKNGNAT